MSEHHPTPEEWARYLAESVRPARNDDSPDPFALYQDAFAKGEQFRLVGRAQELNERPTNPRPKDWESRSADFQEGWFAGVAVDIDAAVASAVEAERHRIETHSQQILEEFRTVDAHRRWAERCVGSLPLEIGERFDRDTLQADAASTRLVEILAALRVDPQGDPK